MDNDNQFLLISKNNFFYKSERLFLPFLGVIWVCFLPRINKYVYTPCVFFVIGMIIFSNFPGLVTYNNKKPIYFEELFLNQSKLPMISLTPQIKTRYKITYTRVLIVTNSVLVSVLSEYWLYKTDDVNSLFEIVGVTGGILKIFQIINHYIGTATLMILKNKIRIESARECELVSPRCASSPRGASSSTSSPRGTFSTSSPRGASSFSYEI
jgi:hypothetical protein